MVPVAIALLLAALLAPAVHWLQAARACPAGWPPRWSWSAGWPLLGGVLTFVVVTFVRGVPDLASQLSTSVGTIVSG